MKKLIVLIILFAVFRITGYGQDEKFKALFMYNFTKNIDWPSGMKSGNFVIGVLGESPIAKEMKIIGAKKKIGNQPLVVVNYKSYAEIGDCHILFVSTGKSKDLGAVIAKISGKNVLVITEKEGSVQAGAGINYVKDGNKIKFEINQKNIEKYGLKVASSLIQLGVAVQ